MQRTTACNGVGGRADLEINIARADPLMRSVTNLPTAHVPTRIPHDSHAFPSCRFQSQQNFQVPQLECLRHIFGHKLRFVFKRSALAPIFGQRPKIESRWERVESRGCGRPDRSISDCSPQPSHSLPSARSAHLFLSTCVSLRRNGHPAVSPPQITSHDVCLKLANLATAR